MKRIFPYPFLLIIAIVLNRVVTWMAQIDPAQSLRSLLVLLCLGAVTSLITQYFVKNWHRTDFMLFMFAVAGVIYRSVYHGLVKDFPQQADYLGIALILLLGLLYAILVTANSGSTFANLPKSPTTLVWCVRFC